MTARILVVDDIPTNVKLLEAKLRSDYYEVLSAPSGAEGLAVALSDHPDLILLDVMMPGMDGFETCRRLKADSRLAHIPVIMVTALDGNEDRVRGLEAGADDFLTKPIDETALMARIRNLVRLKLMRDELRLRQGTAETLAVIGHYDTVEAAVPRRIVLLDDNAGSARRITQTLSANQGISIETVSTPQAAFGALGEATPDLLIVTLTSTEFDGLRVCSQTRSIDFMRHVPLLVIADETQKDRLLKALDLGINDYLLRPIDRNELIARVQTQFRWKSYQDRLRETYRQSLEMATTDSLTGLYNRRYLTAHLERLVEKSRESRKDCAVLVLDIDYFKRINDTYGHAAGDRVLREIGDRLKANLRGIDLACRYGGEEFVVLMPETDLEGASRVAERLRLAIAGRGFAIDDAGKEIDVTISIGGASLGAPSDAGQDLIRRADRALYEAKSAGRNRVIASAA